MIDGLWTITQALYERVVTDYPASTHPRLLEIGAGASTEDWVNAGYQVTSVEHDKSFIDVHPGVAYHHIPLVANYYDPTLLGPVLTSTKWNIILIDGPPGRYGTREKVLGALQRAKVFPDVLIVDDTHRKDGLGIVAGLRRTGQYAPASCVRQHTPPHYATIMKLEQCSQ